MVAYARNHEGRINWEYVATNMRRSSDHCRKRWSRSLLTFYKGALKDLVRECCAEMGAEIAELNGTAKGPPKWTLEEEMQVSRNTQTALCSPTHTLFLRDFPLPENFQALEANGT